MRLPTPRAEWALRDRAERLAYKQIEIAEDAWERMLCATKQVQDGRLDVSALLYEIGQFLTYRSRV